MSLMHLNPQRNVDGLKISVDRWIEGEIRQCQRLGRTQLEFPQNDFKGKIDQLSKEQNVNLYQGAGNIFNVNYGRGDPIIVQSRPLAQRIVRLKFTAGR